MQLFTSQTLSDGSQSDVTVTCGYDGCAQNDCCSPNPTCTERGCSLGTHVIAANGGELTLNNEGGVPSTGVDDVLCCEGNPSCAASATYLTTSAPVGKKCDTQAGAHVTDSTTPCAFFPCNAGANECCDPNAQCRATDCGVGWFLKPDVVGTNAVCVGKECTQSECCNANQTCTTAVCAAATGFHRNTRVA
jgi:hypothetical protein